MALEERGGRLNEAASSLRSSQTHDSKGVPESCFGGEALKCDFWGVY